MSRSILFFLELRARRSLAIAVFLSLSLGAPAAHGQIEVRAQERTEAMAALELPEIPLMRWALPAQELAVWLPEGWREVPNVFPSVETFSPASPGIELHLERYATEPGASLIQILENVVDALKAKGALQEAETVRRLRVASRDALEVTGAFGTGDEDGESDGEGQGQVRVVILMDADREHGRTILLADKGDPEGGRKADARRLDLLLMRILRDFAPLDGTGWSMAVERSRSSLVGDGSGLAWAERNRLFEAISRPAAIGQPWVAEGLEELREKDPALLLDGLFHHHPRVRIATIEALEELTAGAQDFTIVLAGALLDPDPAVRFHLARRVLGDPALAGAVLDRVLNEDSEVARGGALQLLSLAPEESRPALLRTAFSRLRRYPEESQVLLALLLSAWGPEEEAERELLRAWKRSRREKLRRAALLVLLDRGHEEALAFARERLAEGEGEDVLDPDPAAEALAIHASAADGAAPWRSLVTSLEEAQEELSAEEADSGPGEAHRVLRELAALLESLPVGAGTEAECQALSAGAGSEAPPWIGASWAARRRERLECPREQSEDGGGEPAPILVRSRVPRPGALGLSLLSFFDRMELRSASRNQVFHAMLDRVRSGLDHWAGDPVTMTSTGIDLEKPWSLDLSPPDPAEGEGERAAGEGSAEATGRFVFRFSSTHRDAVLGTLLRTAAGEEGLDRLKQSVLFSGVLSLAPTGLLATWDDEQERLAGTDSAASTPPPVERYVALGSASSEDGLEYRPLYELEIRRGVAHWRKTHIFFDGDQGLLSHRRQPALLRSPASAPVPASYGVSYQLDLAEALPYLSPKAEKIGRAKEVLPPDLTFSAGTLLEPEALATEVSIAGLPSPWASLGRNVPLPSLRAPRELLPESTFLWFGASFHGEALARLIHEHREKLLGDLRPRQRKRILEAVDELQGEAGLAILGVPDPRDGEKEDAWGRQAIFYVAVDSEDPSRILRRLGAEKERYDGREVWRLDDLFAVPFDHFLVFAPQAESLGSLGQAPFLAESSLFRQIGERAPPEAMAWMGVESSQLADAVRESLDRGDGDSPGAFLVDLFEAFGNSVSWLQAAEGAIEGQIAALPALQSEESMARVRRLSGYAAFTRGSVPTRWLPKLGLDDPTPTAVDLVLRLPEEVPGLDLDWHGGRLEQVSATTGELRFISRAAEPLPEESALILPISGPELLPFLRNEADMGLHVKELQELAETIRGDETDPAKIVRAIVEWAHENLDYSFNAEGAGVEEILATRQADCTEFSQLTIALARSLGIPARSVSGAHLGHGAAYFHQWAEVYLDRWYEIDPTWGVVQIPPTSLRIPVDDIGFVGSFPGARIVVEAFLDEEGEWNRGEEEEPASPEESR